ncbi:MAG: lactate utilization protein [candidate division KSB1 bacterium]|nr:lactate utilization protein [candidate division KSB1 bacterium]MDZ7300802.1 lactate utilization protein [candidate division KSB1 bacterium]MDZ7309927.1 lactate utilization protein [candidate division KSB1 bacterium]
MSSARDQILRNLRKSAANISKTEWSKPLPSAQEDAAIYRNYEIARQQTLKTFADKFAALKGEFHHSKDAPAAAKTLHELLNNYLAQSNAGMIITDQRQPIRSEKLMARHRHPLLDRIFAADHWLSENTQIIDRQTIASANFANFAIGITAVDFLIARTGSIVLSSATAGGRRLSVLPPFHIAIATIDQLVLSLDEALKRYDQRGVADLSSYATIITGPSRTSDIEKILVLGAHGPKRLAVIVVDEHGASQI